MRLHICDRPVWYQVPRLNCPCPFLCHFWTDLCRCCHPHRCNCLTHSARFDWTRQHIYVQLRSYQAPKFSCLCPSSRYLWSFQRRCCHQRMYRFPGHSAFHLRMRQRIYRLPVGSEVPRFSYPVLSERHPQTPQRRYCHRRMCRCLDRLKCHQ